MIYFYHHYELPYVLQQAQLQQVIIQRQQQQQQQHQQQQQQHHHHQHAHQQGTGEFQPDITQVDVTIRPVQHFSIRNGLNNLGRLRAVLLRRRRVRTFDPPPTPPPTTEQQSSSTPQTTEIASADSSRQQPETLAAMPVTEQTDRASAGGRSDVQAATAVQQ